LTKEYLEHTQDLVKDQSRICGFFRMTDYDYDMSVLFEELKQYINRRFTGPVEFNHQDRFVFLLDDLDSFFDVPLTLYNLQLILRELDISNSFCRIITNFPNYQQYADRVQQRLVADIPLPVIDSSLYFQNVYNHRVAPIETGTVSHPFVILSRLSRFHRTFFMSELFAHGLQDVGLVSYHNIPATYDQERLQLHKETVNTQAPLKFVYPVPYTRGNHEYVIRTRDKQIQVNEFQSRINSFINFNESVVGVKKNAQRYQHDVIQNGLIYVGLETAVNTPEPFITQISFKGITNRRPFVIFGSPNTLNFIRELGFKTFSNYWDEGYDLEPDFTKRAELIVQILNDISAQDITHLLEDMEPILEYNYQHFINNFSVAEKQKLIKGIINGRF